MKPEKIYSQESAVHGSQKRTVLGNLAETADSTCFAGLRQSFCRSLRGLLTTERDQESTTGMGDSNETDWLPDEDWRFNLYETRDKDDQMGEKRGLNTVENGGKASGRETKSEGSRPRKKGVNSNQKQFWN